MRKLCSRKSTIRLALEYYVKFARHSLINSICARFKMITVLYYNMNINKRVKIKDKYLRCNIRKYIADYLRGKSREIRVLMKLIVI